jgi:acyl-CoA synthetase
MEAKVNISTIKELWSWRLSISKNATFLIEDGQKYTYEDVADLVNKQIKLLKSNGVNSGDLVALQFELDLENVVTILACIELGAVINPLNPHLDTDEVKNLITKFKPMVIISQKSVRGRDTISNYTNLGHYEAKTIQDLKFFVRSPRVASPFSNENGPNAAAIVLNTSGTSGLPKGVVLTNQNILSAELSYNQAFGINKNDMSLLLSGMYHAIGFHHGLISTLIAGSQLVITKRYDIEKVAELIKRMPITFIDSLPTIMYDLLFKVSDLGHLRQLICGGDKIKNNILNKARERHIPLYNCYGLTEAVPFSYTPQSYYRKKQGMTTAVTAMKGVKIRIVENHQVIQKHGIQGVIEVSGPIIFREYLDNPQKTVDSFDSEWFITGDIGHYNDDDLLEIDSRSSDKIIRGGENISAHMVEDKIKNCQNVSEVAVLGVPDVRLGQRIGAFIVLNKNKQILKKDDLISELKSHKVDKKLWPEKLWIVDSLPKTANGKIKKYLLKNWLEGRKINEKQIF